MVFNSIEFLIFLPVVFLLFWSIFNRRGVRTRNWFLVAVSYVFYGWWDWRFLAIIIFTSLSSFLLGLGVGACRERKRRMALVLNTSNIVINLGILFLFKYYNFFVSEILMRLPFLGSDPILVDLILPVGISFYTFQALSYTIDIYRGNLAPSNDADAYFAYISFFPQLVAGPIEKAGKLLPQFARLKRFTYADAADGGRQMLWGFFKKIVIADPCGEYVDYIFGNSASLPGSTLLIGVVLFTVQVYCDFSGYSDIAIGLARWFGISLSTNFRFPYFAENISEFWRRWHVSLNTFFRDYIYFPLGGSRVGLLKTARNIIIVFLLSGLWHGANWSFILWGLYNALLVVLWMLYNAMKRRNPSRPIPEGKKKRNNVLSILVLMFFVVMGWVFFRADSAGHAFSYFNGIFSSSLVQRPYMPGGLRDVALRVMLPVAFLFGIEWFHRTRAHGFEISYVRSAGWRWGLYYALIVCILFYFFNFHQGVETFIYFQF